MSEDTDPDRFSEAARTYLYRLATARNLGLAHGRWTHPRYGDLQVVALYGWLGRIYFTLIFCETPKRLALGQGRLWWYLSDASEDFQFKHVVRPPMAEIAINDASDLDEEIDGRLRWLETRRSIEDALAGLYGKGLAGAALGDEARADVRAALAAELPKGDEEDA
jgi:hypothetical protein